MAQIAAIVLAAGASRRHLSGDKLARAYKGAPLVDHALDVSLAAPFAKRVAVVSNAGAPAARAAQARGFEIVVNPRANDGMGTSLAAGIAACLELDAVAVFLGDMPEIRAETVRRLLAAYGERPAPVLCPAYQGRRGHPALFGRERFGALLKLAGDQGARGLIDKDAAARALDTDDPGILFDVDTEADFVAHAAARSPERG
jgi:molybdenum cofactor cytidylyltransferase